MAAQYQVEVYEVKADGSKIKVYEQSIPTTVGDVREITRQVNAIVQNTRK